MMESVDMKSLVILQLPAHCIDVSFKRVPDSMSAAVMKPILTSIISMYSKKIVILSNAITN